MCIRHPGYMLIRVIAVLAAMGGICFAGAYGDERQLGYLRHLSGPRRLVPVAGALLAWKPGPGYGQPSQLPSGLPMLQDAGKRLIEGDVAI